MFLLRACACFALFLSQPVKSRSAATGDQSAELALFSGRPASAELISTTDSLVIFSDINGDPSLQVATGTSNKWPGIAIKPPEGSWELSSFGSVLLRLRNVNTNPVTIYCRLDNPGADGSAKCLTASIELKGSGSGELRVPLKSWSESTLGGKLFGMRGYPVSTGAPSAFQPGNVTQLLVFVSPPDRVHRFEILNIRANGRSTPPTAWANDADPFFPCIDTFGQYQHKDWPGKIHSLAELAERRDREHIELSRKAERADWDKYGGWLRGPQLDATGYFRTEKVQGKWWLVDPDGRLFFSHGIDCVNMRDSTAIEEREAWFADFPGELPGFQAFAGKGSVVLKGHYAGRAPASFSFGGANLLRKYGPDWKKVYPMLIHRRLRDWGLNSIGMWSDAGVFLLRRTPYVDAISSHGARMIQGSEGYWGKFPDVWDPGFQSGLSRSMQSKARQSANDPWCIGYFADNEMSWGDETSLSLAALLSPPEQPAKEQFVADLKEKYAAIERLNAAWGASYASWDALLQSTSAPDKKKAHSDLTAFYSRTAEQYFRTMREAIKRAAPHQLYLGCRFAWVNPLAAAAAAKYCDIVSYNLYRRTVADFEFNGGADVPLIIGEFHFGALDRGLFHTGLVPVRNQAERAQTYQEYVQGALRHPSFVGCHWFQYQDEPTTGRLYDEENYQIGFVDIADTPYGETVQAASTIADTMYSIRFGP